MNSGLQSTLQFWTQQYCGEINRPIVILRGANTNQVGRWPGYAPSLGNILAELQLAKMVYVRIVQREGSDHRMVEVMSSRTILRASIRENDNGAPRIWLHSKNGVSYADNNSRALMVSRGFRLSVNGVYCPTGQEFNAYERQDAYWSSGRYVSELLGHARLAKASSGIDGADSFVEEEKRTDDELHLLDTLQQYIDVEHEQEEMVARQTPPFSYIAIKAEPRKIVYRQFYRVTFTQSDYQRLCESAPGLLRFDIGDEEEGPTAQVVDLSPSRDNPEVIVSIEQQASVGTLPESGRLYLAAIPTLHKVRSDVVERLRDGRTDNPWLISVAAGEYLNPDYVIHDVSPPPAAYPPTATQLKAFRMGISTPDYTLTLGPPGTGKTTVILNWVRALISNGERVLVTSQNNKAVDNVLERLAEEEGLECVRIGAETKVSTALHPILVDNAATRLQKLLAGRIDETLKYLADCLSYFTELRPKVIELEHANSLCVSLAKKRDKVKQEKLEPLLSELKNRESKKRMALDRRQQCVESMSILQQKYEWWQARHPVLKPVTIVMGALIRIRQKLARLRERRLTRTLDRASRRCDEMAPRIENVNSKINEISMALNAVIEDRVRSWPPAPKSPYADVNFGFDLKNEYLQVGVSDIEQRLNQITSWRDAVEGWKKALSSARQQALYRIAIEMVDVVGATCIGINTNSAFRDVPFNTVIVDESGQIQLHNLIVPLSRGERAILVGDHKQLPPVVQQEITDELDARGVDAALMKDSWFERLWDATDDSRKVILDTQYRCPAIISDYISEAFYCGDYHAGHGMDKKPPLFSFTKSPMLFVDTASASAKERAERAIVRDGATQVQDNPLETKVVVELLEKALMEKPELGDGEIGIVVPYKNHVAAIQSAIIKAKKNGRLQALNMLPMELVASVDSFQGQERDLIIMTFTRSNQSATVGFLKDWRRLNVGMTRAKRQLIMVGDMSTLSLSRPRKNGQADTAEEFKSAMMRLKVFVKERAHYMDIHEWVNICGRPNSKHGEVVV